MKKLTGIFLAFIVVMTIAPQTVLAAPYSVLTASVVIKETITISNENGNPIITFGKSKYSLEPQSVINCNSSSLVINLKNDLPITIGGIVSNGLLKINGANAQLNVLSSRNAAIEAQSLHLIGANITIHAHGIVNGIKTTGTVLDKGCLKLIGKNNMLCARGGDVDVELGNFLIMRAGAKLIADKGHIANVRSKRYICISNNSQLIADAGTASIAVQASKKIDVLKSSIIKAVGRDFGIQATDHIYISSRANVSASGGQNGIMSVNSYFKASSGANITASGAAHCGISVKKNFTIINNCNVTAAGGNYGLFSGGGISVLCKSKLIAKSNGIAGTYSANYTRSVWGSLISADGGTYGMRSDNYVLAECKNTGIDARGRDFGIWVNKDEIEAECGGYIRGTAIALNGKGIVAANKAKVLSLLSGYIHGTGQLEGIETIGGGTVKAICKGKIIGETHGIRRGALAIKSSGGISGGNYCLIHEIYRNSLINLNSTTPFMLREVYPQLKANIKDLAVYNWETQDARIWVSNNGLLADRPLENPTFHGWTTKYKSGEPVTISSHKSEHRFTFIGEMGIGGNSLPMNFWLDDPDDGRLLGTSTYPSQVQLGSVVTLDQNQLNLLKPIHGYREGIQVGGPVTITEPNQVINVYYEKAQLQKVTIKHFAETDYESGEYVPVTSLTQIFNEYDGVVLDGADYSRAGSGQLLKHTFEYADPDFLEIVANPSGDPELNTIEIYYTLNEQP